MADSKAIEDCKREISLLQVFQILLFFFFAILTFCLKSISAIKSSKCN